MSRPSENFLPPSLERQLERIEIIGNAEADQRAQDAKHLSISDDVGYGPHLFEVESPSEKEHRISTARDQFFRKSSRTKKFGYLLLGFVPVTASVYVASIFLESPLLGLISMLLSSVMIGFGVVVILMANRTIKEVTATKKK